jgi:hypothetical protein
MGRARWEGRRGCGDHDGHSGHIAADKGSWGKWNMAGAEGQAKRAEVIGLLEQIRDMVIEDAEFRDRVPASPVASAVVEMLSRALGLYKASVLLLSADLIDEALLLGRSLFEQSLWLAELADTDGKRRASLVLGWLNQSYIRARDLVHSGASASLEPVTSSQDEMLAAVDERIKSVRQFQREYDIGGLTEFLGTEQAARRFDRLDGWWTYELANTVAPADDTPYEMRRSESVPEIYFTKTADAAVIATYGVFCAESVIAAHVAAAKLLERELPRVAEVHDTYAALEAITADDSTLYARQAQ